MLYKFKARVMNMEKRIENHNIVENSLKNPAIQTLLNKSHLTKKQLETLLIWKNLKMQGGKIVIENKVKVLEKIISKGTFYRILSQAKANVKKSVITIVLLVILDLMDYDDLVMLNKVIISMFDSEKEIKEGVLSKITDIVRNL